MWIEDSALATITVLNKTDWRIRTDICNPFILVVITGSNQF